MRTRTALARDRLLWLGAGALVVVAAAASLAALNRPELRDAGVGTTTDWGQGSSTPALEVLLEDGRGRAAATLPGFSPEVIGGELTGAQRHRNGVARVLSEISNHLQRNGIAATPPLVRYASQAAPLTDYGLPILDWPASSLADGDFTPDGAHGAYRCRLLSPQESSAVRAAARDATGRVLWRIGADTWLVVLSPLLPGETACTRSPVTIAVDVSGGLRSGPPVFPPAVTVRDGLVSSEDLPGRAVPVDLGTASRWAAALRAAGVGTRTDWGPRMGDSMRAGIRVVDPDGTATASILGLEFSAGLTDPGGIARRRVLAVLVEIRGYVVAHG